MYEKDNVPGTDQALTSAVIFCFSNCTESKKSQKETEIVEKLTPEEDLVSKIEKAHNKAGWDTAGIIKYPIIIKNDQEVRLEGTFFQTPALDEIKFSTNGKTVFYQNGEVKLHPETEKYPNARFDIMTWPYFFSIPFKLSDKGVNVQETGMKKLGDKEYETLKLTFEKGTGDSPGDWYIIYVDPSSYVIKAAAYIVTYGQPKAEAEQNPHVVKYDEYTQMENVPVPSSWSIYDWDSTGMVGAQLSKIDIPDAERFAYEDEIFEVPDEARNVPMGTYNAE